MSNDYLPWNRYPRLAPEAVERVQWRHDLPDFAALPSSVLPYGNGRSYGDTCLNEGGTLLDARPLDRLIAFDRENGVLTCEAGITVKQLLQYIVPAGWFVPVSPGTQFVTVGGAIAHDVHGKNHGMDGTFGCHVTRFELARSTGERVLCSRDENADLFAATIGGLGLTGLITWAEFTLKRIPSSRVDVESIQFHSVDEFFQLSHESADTRYTVSWVDTQSSGANFGRGVFQRGDFFDPVFEKESSAESTLEIPVPIHFPSFTVNSLTTRIFNELYFRKQIWPYRRSITPYHPFFYPLDIALDWYKVYGRKGFLQYQFVMDYQHSLEPIKEVLMRIARSGQASPLVVFKTFGDIVSPGLLSFPRPGVTLALDFPLRGQSTLRLLDELDEIVFDNGGRLYPAKDARMSGQRFRQSYPNWEDFAHYVDPAFSSSFWRRVTADAPSRK